MAYRPGRKTATVLRAAVHVGALLPLLWLYYAIPRGLLGGDPVEDLTHFLGIGALRLLLLTLCVSPLARILKFGLLIRLRRPLGLWCFVWASLHFYVWLGLDLSFTWSLIGEEIVKRTYILVGFTAWAILLVLAITSLPALVRKLGRNWRRLHSTIYAVVLLGCLHYWWAVKSGWIEPAIYLAVALFLLWLRRERLPLVAEFLRRRSVSVQARRGQ